MGVDRPVDNCVVDKLWITLEGGVDAERADGHACTYKLLC